VRGPTPQEGETKKPPQKRFVVWYEVQVLQTTGVSYAFVGWLDGGAREHVFMPVNPGANNSRCRVTADSGVNCLCLLE
jgi:hypothetical protein